MDPSKRVCLKNIPPNCTKREIAEFIRNRTGAQPHSIDLGLDAEGEVRRYAHFSVEGAKQVIPALTGAAWRDGTVTALPARPHYTFRLAEARRRRERAEAEEREAVEAFWAQRTERWLARTGGELPKGKPPRPFYVTRQRYAAVASEIAQRMREEHKRKNSSQREKAGAGGQQQHRREVVKAHTQGQDQHQKQRYYKEKSAVKGKPQRKHARAGPSASPSAGEKKSKVEIPVPPQQQQQQTKEERKLSGLQAKLAALRAKMK